MIPAALYAIPMIYSIVALAFLCKNSYCIRRLQMKKSAALFLLSVFITCCSMLLAQSQAPNGGKGNHEGYQAKEINNA
jgi:hypothetical protein